MIIVTRNDRRRLEELRRMLAWRENFSTGGAQEIAEILALKWAIEKLTMEVQNGSG